MAEIFADRVLTREASDCTMPVEFADENREVRGHVRVLIEENGKTWFHHAKHNLIVNTARKTMAHLVAEGGSTYVISTMHWGTKGHSGTDILTPITPTITDTGLIEDVYQKAIGSFEYLPVGVETSVKFTTVLEKTEGNGTGTVAYTEAGMFSANATMFARETFPAIIKNASRRIIFEWTFLF